MKRQQTPRGMAELTDFRLRSPDTVFGEDITPSLFSEEAEDVETRQRAQHRVE